jgi:hypothetical protein
MPRLSQDLENYFFREDAPQQVCLADILELAGERIFGFLFVILALPSALPIPAPGYSTPFGFLIFLLSVQLIYNSPNPWLPPKLRLYLFPVVKIQGILKVGLPWLKRLESLARPRLGFVCDQRLGLFVIGVMISLMAISMMIPIPGTNTLPAMGILVTGFGLLEKDGLISLAGLVLCLLGMILSTSIIVAVVWGGTSLLDTLKQWLRR